MHSSVADVSKYRHGLRTECYKLASRPIFADPTGRGLFLVERRDFFQIYAIDLILPI
jgi:hypothetical protein